MRIAIVGGGGFIGSAVAGRFHASKKEGDEILPISLRRGAPRGERFDRVIYCSGLAWGAQTQPTEAFDLHVFSVGRLVAENEIGTLVYLSSTRLYDGADSTSEDAALRLECSTSEDVYRVSKIAGEVMALTAHPNAYVVRLSNVYGPNFTSGLFLSDVLRQAAATGRVSIRTSMQSEKDYVSVSDAADAICAIASCAGLGDRIINVASGENTSHRAIFDALAKMGVQVDVADGSPTTVARPIEIARLQAVMNWNPRSVVLDLAELLARFQEHAKVPM